jgi:hypothetical protein
MIRYDLPRFILEVGVVDAEVGVEPLHLVGDEFAWDKPLELSGTISQSLIYHQSDYKRDKNLESDIFFDEGALFILALEDWCSVARKVVNAIGVVGLCWRLGTHSKVCGRIWCRRHKTYEWL